MQFVSTGALLFSATAAMTGNISVAGGATLGYGGLGGGGFTTADVDNLFAGSVATVTMAPTALVGIDTTVGALSYDTSVVSSTFGLNKLGSNTLTLTGANAYSGGTTITGGTLAISADTNLGAAGTALNFNGGTLDTGANVLSLTGRAVTTGSGATITNATAGSLTLSSAISGAGSLTKTGAGTLTMSGGTLTAGGLTINGGATIISGSGTSWTNTAGNCIVGSTTSGNSLTVSAGAGVIPVSGTYTCIGNAVGSNNNLLTISGAGSKLGTSTVRSALYVGRSSGNGNGGNGNKVSVEAGGYLATGWSNSQRSIIGTGSTGNNVTVTGSGSQWYVGGNYNIYVGLGGVADTNNGLLISDGGLLTMGAAQFVLIGAVNLASANYANVTGAGSTWAMAASQLALGGGGTTAGTGGALNCTSNTLSVTNGGVLSNLNWLMIGNSSAAANNNSALIQSAGVLEINTGIVAGTATATGNTLTVDTAGILQFKSATPTITIAAGNSITLNGGTLAYKSVATGDYLNNNTLGSGVGLFTWTGSNTFRLDGSVETGTAAYSFGGSGTNYRGLELYGAAVMAGRAITLDATNANPGTLLLNGATAANNLAGGLTLIGPVSVTASGSASTLTGVVTGSGALTKVGAATLTLASATTYSGDTTVSDGTLKLANPNPNNDASTLTIASGATLELAFNETGGDVTDTVAKLYIGATLMPAGVYGASGSGATSIDDTHFAGVGTLTVTTGGGAPAIAVEQPLLTNIPNNGTQDFGTVLVGANTSLTFTIRNAGSADLTGLTITKDGANPADFTVTTNPSAPVSGPSGTTTFTVQFAPSASGVESAAIHIANNVATANPFTITLTGSGATSYNNWAVSKGLTALNKGPGQDPDNDGTTNLAEFAFNGNPLSGSDNGQLYVLTADGDGDTLKELILTAAVRKTAVFTAGAPATSALVDGIIYSIEGSTSLGSFAATVNLVTPALVPAGAPVLTGTDYEYRSFSLGGSNGLAGAGFLRARVTQP